MLKMILINQTFILYVPFPWNQLAIRQSSVKIFNYTLQKINNEMSLPIRRNQITKHGQIKCLLLTRGDKTPFTARLKMYSQNSICMLQSEVQT